MTNHHRIDSIELGATDMAASKAFYAAAFGWPFTDWGSASFDKAASPAASPPTPRSSREGAVV